MCKFALPALIGLLLHLATPAQAVQPFVGSALQYDVAFPHYDFQSLTSSGWIHDFGCWGSEFTAGLAWPDFSVYAGYHFVSSSVYGELELARHNSWREKRYLLGARWHLNSLTRSAVLPTVGAALTYGQSTLMWKNHHTPSERSTLRKSENVGVMVEFGFLIRANSLLDFSVMAQGHRLEPDFGNDHDEGTPDRYLILMPGWQVGMRVRLPEIK